MALPAYPYVDVDDYLHLDRHNTEKRYEYLDGELRMLAGGSTYHSRIIANLTGILYALFKEGPCTIYHSDIRLQLSESRYVHPDITVSCDERDNELNDMIHYPHLVVEVLSLSTEAIDRGKKFIYYQECSTIQEYLMVDSQSIRIEAYHREGDGWKFHTYGPDSIVKVESFGVLFSVNDIYKGMKLSDIRHHKNG